MKSRKLVPIFGGVALLVGAGLVYSQAGGNDQELSIDHSNCSYFGADREKITEAGMRAKGVYRSHVLSDLTTQVQQAMNYVPPGSPTYTFNESHTAGSIDS